MGLWQVWYGMAGMAFTKPPLFLAANLLRCSNLSLMELLKLMHNVTTTDKSVVEWIQSFIGYMCDLMPGRLGQRGMRSPNTQL